MTQISWIASCSSSFQLLCQAVGSFQAYYWAAWSSLLLNDRVRTEMQRQPWEAPSPEGCCHLHRNGFHPYNALNIHVSLLIYKWRWWKSPLSESTTILWNICWMTWFTKHFQRISVYTYLVLSAYSMLQNTERKTSSASARWQHEGLVQQKVDHLQFPPWAMGTEGIPHP